MSSPATRFALFGLTIAAALTAATTSVQADDLFSTGDLGSVFATPDKQPAVETKVLEPSELGAFLRSAGYQVKDAGGDIYTMDFQRDDWTFPMAFTISPNRENFWIIMFLRSNQDRSTLTTDRLLGLMAANNTYGPAHFVYNPETRQLNLNRPLSNRGLTADELREKLNQLVAVAIETSNIWSGDSDGQQTRAGGQDDPNTNIVGKWLAVRTDLSVIGLRFNADGTFLLIHEQDGSKTQYEGRYSFAGNVLRLASNDGNRLEGPFTWSADGGFQFQPNTAKSPLEFSRLDETKQS